MTSAALEYASLLVSRLLRGGAVSLTPAQIVGLRAEAIEAGDIAQAILCDIARGIMPDEELLDQLRCDEAAYRYLEMGPREARAALTASLPCH